MYITQVDNPFSVSPPPEHAQLAPPTTDGGGWQVGQGAAVLPAWGMALLVLASIAVTLSLLLTIMYCLKRSHVKDREDAESNSPNGGTHRRSIEFVLPQPPATYPSEPQTELMPAVFAEIEEEATQHEPPPTPLQRPRDRHSTTSASSMSTSSACSSPTRRKASGSRSRGSVSVQLEELDLSMYGEARDDELRGVTTIFSRGRICFSVAHDTDNECVIVNILRAHALTSSQIPTSGNTGRTFMTKQRRPGRIDSCVKLQLLGNSEQGFVTKVVRDNCDPVYEASFCFHLSKFDTAAGVMVRLCIQELDRFSRRTDIGIVTFHLSDLEGQASPGDVMELWRDITSEKQVLSVRGQILVSLQYDYRERILRTGVLSARDLILPHFADSTPDQGVVYVKLTLISNEKVLSRRKSLSRRLSDNPNFCDGFSFPVDFNMLENVTLVFTVYARDLTGKSTMIGRANVGSLTYASGAGLAHWNEMLTAPSAVTEVWHNIY